MRKVFRDAELSGKEEIEAWVASVSPLPSAELVKLLPFLSDKALNSDNARHRTRCYAFLKLAESVRDPQLFVPYAACPESCRRGPALAIGGAPATREQRLRLTASCASCLAAPDEATRQAAGKVLAELASRTGLQGGRGLGRAQGFRAAAWRP